VNLLIILMDDTEENPKEDSCTWIWLAKTHFSSLRFERLPWKRTMKKMQHC